MSAKALLLGHSPDPDDAFMFYGLAAGKIDTGDWRFEHILQDIQTLNDRAARGELHVTAVSIHAYAHVCARYALTACGASVGDGYGPLIVARRPMTVADLPGKTIAVPGATTTAMLALSLLLGRNSFHSTIVKFDQILSQVASGLADAGLIIHEGQLTYQNHHLHRVVDLGEWWKADTGLPLPLGGNCVRRDLGQPSMVEIADILSRSIRYGLDHRAEAVAHALGFARDLNIELADRFIGMYVNEWTVDLGDAGRRAVELLLKRGAQAGLVPAVGYIDIVG